MKLFIITLLYIIASVQAKGQWWNQEFHEESLSSPEDANQYPPTTFPYNKQQSQNPQVDLPPHPLENSQTQYGRTILAPTTNEGETNKNGQKTFSPLLPPPPSFTYSQDIRRRSRNSKTKASSAILVGEICDPTDSVYSKCSENAQCIHTEGVYKCNCSFAYESTSTKKCLRSYGQYCDAKDPCNYESRLVCIDNRCECGNSDVYQIAGDKCRSKVGGPCNPITGPDCVANSLCLSFDKFARQSRCVCKDGFVETYQGTCLPGVGMPCNGKGDCNSPPLVCKEGVCSCREAVHVYDSQTNSCVGLVGSQCCTNFDGVDCMGVTNSCVIGAYCKKLTRNMPGRCVCQSYNLESDDRTCSINPTLGIVG